MTECVQDLIIVIFSLLLLIPLLYIYFQHICEKCYKRQSLIKSTKGWLLFLAIGLNISICLNKGVSFSTNEWYKYSMFVVMPDLLRISVFIIVYYFLKKAVKGDPNKVWWKIGFKALFFISILFNCLQEWYFASEKEKNMQNKELKAKYSDALIDNYTICSSITWIIQSFISFTLSVMFVIYIVKLKKRQ